MSASVPGVSVMHGVCASVPGVSVMHGVCASVPGVSVMHGVCASVPGVSVMHGVCAVFLSGAVNMTEPQVQRIIAEVVSQNTNITYNKSVIYTVYGVRSASKSYSHHRVLEGFTDEVVTMDARYAWKYAASRSITGTPQFIVNGVHVPTAPQFSVSDWTNFMNTLLNSPYPII